MNNENKLKELIIADAIASKKITPENAEKITNFSVEELKNLFWLNAKLNMGHFIERYKDYKCDVKHIYQSAFADTKKRTESYLTFKEYIKKIDCSSGINCLRDYDYEKDYCVGYVAITVEQLLLGNVTCSDRNNFSCYELNFKIDHESRTINAIDRTYAFD